MSNNLRSVIIPNTGIQNWIGTFGTEKLHDYGLEFLSAIREGKIKNPPNNLILPSSVLSSDLEDKVAELVNARHENLSEQEKRITARDMKKSVRKTWTNGGMPPSIKALLSLMEYPIRNFAADLLNPLSYDGTNSQADGIPLSLKNLGEIAYLTGSAIVAGDISNPHYHLAIFYPSHTDARQRVYERVGIFFSDMNPENRNFISFPTHFGRLLSILGMKPNKLRDAKFYELGVDYLSMLAKYLEKCDLRTMDRNDYEHAKSVLKGFVDSVLDHRARTSAKDKTPMIDLPAFTIEDTDFKFAALFDKSLRITYPTFDYGIHAEKWTMNGITYHRSKFYF